ncbi:MAG: glycosyltransferase family protein [Burkholderiales bacterium]|nr:glycosyltransferase family protein [Burkholderiales bacterium]
MNKQAGVGGAAANGAPPSELAARDAEVARWPHSADAHFNRGNALRRLGHHSEALASYDTALRLAPRDEQALNNRGVVLRELGRTTEALASFEQALACRPDYPAALNNRGLALQALGRNEDALAAFAHALTLQTDYTEALGNRAALLADLDRPEEALACYERALALRPDDIVNLVNRGNVLQALKRHAEALQSYGRALALDPDDAQAHWNEALTRLALGDYRRGWAKYEWRWRNPALGMDARLSDRPQWTGEPDIEGKTVLLHAEQGYGDALQFIRYAPRVAALGARVIVACAPQLRALFEGVEGVVQAFAPEVDPVPAFDLHIPLMSLPLAFGTMPETIPGSAPYLPPDAAGTQAWQARLAPYQGRRIGLAWSGNPKFGRARTKACPVALMARLAAVPGCVFVSLQKGDAAAEGIQLRDAGANVLDYTDELADFKATAALVGALDLVISVDTAVAHLAGALGKPVWILLPYAADWRWLVDRDDSPWYPSARLFRQPQRGAWNAVIAKAEAELARWTDAAAGAVS